MADAVDLENAPSFGFRNVLARCWVSETVHCFYCISGFVVKSMGVQSH